ncbi:hypothetical protein GB937_007810 [Aspergillus fischeri]|nr:hypothetical protein GB937_007810 [Aspergillus fischeri]
MRNGVAPMVENKLDHFPLAFPSSITKTRPAMTGPSSIDIGSTPNQHPAEIPFVCLCSHQKRGYALRVALFKGCWIGSCYPATDVLTFPDNGVVEWTSADVV